MANERFNLQEPIARRLEIPRRFVSADFVLLAALPDDLGRHDAWFSCTGSSG